MARPYSMDLRERLIEAVRGGMSARAAAERFGVGVATGVRWARQFRSTGSVAPGQMGGHKKRAIAGAHRDWLLARCRAGTSPCWAWLPNCPSAGCKSIAVPSGYSCTTKASASKKTLVAGEQDRPAIVRRRAQWRRYQSRIDISRLVFIDETWTKTNMAPLRGWGPCGARVRAKAPYGHWNTMTFVAALRHDRIDAPWLIDRPMNSAIFRSYVENVLQPTLRPDEIVVMDNLGSHRNRAVRAAERR